MGLVKALIIDELTTFKPPVVGFSSLAAGADQIFAEVLLAIGGQLTAVLPSEDYEASFRDDPALRRFRALLLQATETVRLPSPEPSEEAFWRAGQEIVHRSEMLLAVWDGRPAGGLGGTADVVRYAREQGRTVKVIWPDGCARD